MNNEQEKRKRAAESAILFATMMSAASPYNETFFPKIRPSPKKRLDTCPVCGARRVMVYWRRGEEMCLKCWNEQEATT